MVDRLDAVVWLHIFAASFLSPILASRQYDLHRYMDEADLAYHFGVSSPEQVPAYDLTTPLFTREYRDFSSYAKKPDWIYPSRVTFDVEAFNWRYRVSAVRNDRLVSPEKFVVNFYEKDGKNNLQRTITPSQSKIRRHYLATSTALFDDADSDEEPDQFNSALSLSEDGVRGLIQGKHTLLRLVPIKRRLMDQFAASFDMGAEEADLATHVVFEVSSSPTQTGMNAQLGANNQPRKKKKKRKKAGAKSSKNTLIASMKLGVIVDFTVYDVMMRWGFRKEHEQVFFIISFYNEVQLMYREPKLMRKLQLTVALQSIAFFNHPQNDLGATPHAEQYIENVCAGPYNNYDFDHIQTLTYVDIYDPNSKRLVAYTENLEFELPHPFRFPWPGEPRWPKQYGNVQEGNRLYDTVGLAWVGSTCDKRKHCSIVEMNSPIASFSAAHEIGHAIGVDHEEQSKCPFDAKDPESSSFMSEMSWSANSWATLGKLPVLTPCTVSAFVEAIKGRSGCLLKPDVDRTNPAVDFRLALRDVIKQPIEPNELCQYLMGELWLNSQKWRREQIKRIYAPVAAGGDEMCQTMDCKVVGVDKPNKAFGFKFGPAVPGTLCAVENRRVCFNFQCVDVNDIPAAALL